MNTSILTKPLPPCPLCGTDAKVDGLGLCRCGNVSCYLSCYRVNRSVWKNRVRGVELQTKKGKTKEQIIANIRQRQNKVDFQFGQ